MTIRSIGEFLAHGRCASLAKGPVALILVEDAVEVDSTTAPPLDCGFRTVLLLAADAALPSTPRRWPAGRPSSPTRWPRRRRPAS